MEVKAGYKQTDIGSIPEDWDLKSISSIAQIVGGGTPSTQIDEYWDGQISWVSAGDVSNADGRYVKETQFHISELGLSNSSTKILPKDTTIIIARGATVGRMAQFGKEMAFNQTCYCLLPNHRLDKNYLYFSMLFSVNSIIALSFGTIFGTITTSSFKDWQIPLPSLAEQKAIAEALSDADALIEALEQLLAKKRQVKQGAMQELLTGKRRLSGFSGKWNEKKLGDIAEITKLAGFEYSKYFNSYQDGGDIIVIRGTNITHNRLDLSDIKTIPRSTSNFLQRSKLQKGDLVFAYVGTIGPIYLITENNKYHLGPNTARITVKDNISSQFVFWYFCSSFAKKEIDEHISVGAQPSLSMTKIRKFKISLPEYSEQTAIAEILSDMDAEVAALEGKLSKARQVKQGMMQELLTGRVRLVGSG
jgi:type I restriction enzyme, S subunit